MHERGLALFAGVAGAVVAFVLLHVLRPDPYAKVASMVGRAVIDEQRLNLLTNDLRWSTDVGIAVFLVAMVGRTAWSLRSSYPLALAALGGMTWLLVNVWIQQMVVAVFRTYLNNRPLGWVLDVMSLVAVGVVAWFIVDALTAARPLRPPKREAPAPDTEPEPDS